MDTLYDHLIFSPLSNTLIEVIYPSGRKRIVLGYIEPASSSKADWAGYVFTPKTSVTTQDMITITDYINRLVKMN